MRILIPGISGGIARRVALRLLLAGHEVAGIDPRPWSEAPPEIERFPVDVRKRAAEDVFRRFRPAVVVHMATVTSLLMSGGEERYRINLGGTQAVFEHCRAYGVEHAIFVGRHTFYGAGPDAPLYHREEDPPIELGRYPELADLVAADLYAATALWRMPQLTTTILRLVYTLGPSGHGTLAAFLRGPVVPSVLGFDPLFQFMHEDDAAAAICLAIAKRCRGIFNVAGPQPLPLSTVVRETGRTLLPLPEALFALALGRAGLPRLPAGALDHIKYPIIVDASAFRAATGFAHAHDEVATLRAFARAFPRTGLLATAGASLRAGP
jgi:UDP-glucose 4-epimerase